MAVEDLSFKVEDGMIYGFLGPNGAGKTTTMNIMTGYLAPTEGEVLINGHDTLEEPEAAKKTIGYLPEQPPLYPDMTVLEYLGFAAELKKVPKNDRKKQIADVISELGLEENAGRLIRNLSKGFRQRVGFAQALLGNPETLILDEPTVGLDPRQIIEIRTLIKQLGKQHTVILSSHILSEVSEICDMVLIISHGRLIACDTPQALGSMRGGTAKLFISAEGTPDAVREAISSAAGGKLQVRETEDGCVRCELDVSDREDVRARVSRALFERGCPVIEMKLETASLESIFLELTGRDEEQEDDAPVSAREAQFEKHGKAPAEMGDETEEKH